MYSCPVKGTRSIVSDLGSNCHFFSPRTIIRDRNFNLVILLIKDKEFSNNIFLTDRIY